MYGFFVPGNPITKGSLTPYQDQRTGRLGVKHQFGKELREWCSRISFFASQARNEFFGTDEAVEVEATFVLKRPGTHYGTGRNAGKVKNSAPNLPTGKKLDIDKLSRALLDALTGVAYVDDGQVTRLNVNKAYGEEQGVAVTVGPAQGNGDDVSTPYRLGDDAHKAAEI